MQVGGEPVVEHGIVAYFVAKSVHLGAHQVLLAVYVLQDDLIPVPDLLAHRVLHDRLVQLDLFFHPFPHIAKLGIQVAQGSAGIELGGD